MQSDKAFRNEQLEDTIVPHVDFPYITKLSVGKYWGRIDKSQKQELISVYKDYLLLVYSSAISEYQNGKIKFLPFQPSSNENRVKVRTTFTQPGSNPIEVTYMLHDRSGWKIYNIEVSQLNLVKSNRDVFANEIKKGGVDGLITTLKNHVLENG